MSRTTHTLRPVTHRTAAPQVLPGHAQLYPLSLRIAHGVLALAALVSLPTAAADVQVTSTRVWPAAEYTRVTIESRQPITHRFFSLGDPDRLVLDLSDVGLDEALGEVAAKVSTSDPYIRGVRIGRFKPDVVRLVFDLKAPVKPDTFALKPIGDYGHRLVLDIYPLEPPDPLLALLKERESAATTTTARTPRTALPPSERLITIAIDPGHGGEDPGARGRRGTLEKDVTLAISRKLKERIDAQHNMRAILLRDGDYFMSLQMRVEKARRVRADLLVSIHADAFTKSSANGSSVFALSERGATSAAASLLAQQENAADLIGGVNIGIKDPYLKQTLLDLSQTASINDSLKLGRVILAEVGSINKLHKNYVEQAGFAVLKAPDIPSILIETAFITNPSEEKRLRDTAYQNKMAAAILNGIKRYFANNPPLAPARIADNS